jgi:tetratricopeptide (TPR) repeat protein
MHKSPSNIFYTLVLALCLLTASTAFGQKIENYEAERERAFQLYNQNKLTDAKEVLERLAVANPRDRDVLEVLGLLIIAHSMNIKDDAERKKERVRGRQMLVRAKELGADSNLLKNMLELIPPDGSDTEGKLSNVKEAEDAMRDAETAFARGDFPKALEAYGRALKLDPKLYEAALFTGDVYRKTDEPVKAAEWFQRAITINPDFETAYRYWGEMLMQDGKLDEARDKLVEAYILAPYYRLTNASLANWGELKQMRLAHPVIEIPTSVSNVEKGKTSVILDPSVASDKEDGKSAWISYAAVRANWMNKKFAETYPNEKQYRHSLAEEMDAFRLVLSSLEQQIKDKKIKQLDPSLARLKKLSEAGLMEAYILLAMADEGIARDHAVYAKANRDKLRRYAIEYVLTGGGK